MQNRANGVFVFLALTNPLTWAIATLSLAAVAMLVVIVVLLLGVVLMGAIGTLFVIAAWDALRGEASLRVEEPRVDNPLPLSVSAEAAKLTKEVAVAVQEASRPSEVAAEANTSLSGLSTKKLRSLAKAQLPQYRVRWSRVRIISELLDKKKSASGLAS